MPIVGIVIGISPSPNAFMSGTRCVKRSSPDAIQINCWVMPTAPAPITLPASRMSGRTLATTTSATRVVFSSMTPRRMFCP